MMIAGDQERDMVGDALVFGVLAALLMGFLMLIIGTSERHVFQQIPMGGVVYSCPSLLNDQLEAAWETGARHVTLGCLRSPHAPASGYDLPRGAISISRGGTTAYCVSNDLPTPRWDQPVPGAPFIYLTCVR